MILGFAANLRESGASFWRVARVPALTLVSATLALNLLGLSIPIAATQIFDRVAPNPNSSTLGILLLGVVVLAFLEALLRLSRAYLLAQAGATYAWLMTFRVLHHVATSDVEAERLRASGSLEYLTAVQKTRDRYSGQVLVSVAELAFLPVVMGAIFLISPVAAAMVAGALVLFGVMTLIDALRLRAVVNAGTANTEERYGFLFSVLGSMHSLKSMAIEDHILRRYETRQAQLAHNNYASSQIVGRLLNSAMIGSQVIIMAVLAFGAIAVSKGDMTLGGVSALVLLGGRVLSPLQRAVFLFVQFKDARAAKGKLEEVFERPVSAVPIEGLRVRNDGRLEVDGLGYSEDENGNIFEGVSLTLNPGETVTISESSEHSATILLQILAGIRAPQQGRVLLNGTPPLHYPQELLNRCVAYVPSKGVMFRGTIRDNITRFGEVTVDQAMDIAALLEIDTLINELPDGLDTKLIGGSAELIPPGLRQQITIMRAIATRPRLLLFDNVDHGLDRQGYARLHRFIGKIAGQASMLIVSDDANLVGQSRRFRLQPEGLLPIHNMQTVTHTAYRSLKI